MVKYFHFYHLGFVIFGTKLRKNQNNIFYFWYEARFSGGPIRNKV
jgi:hypothetical protein